MKVFDELRRHFDKTSYPEWDEIKDKDSQSAKQLESMKELGLMAQKISALPSPLSNHLYDHRRRPERSLVFPPSVHRVGLSDIWSCLQDDRDIDEVVWTRDQYDYLRSIATPRELERGIHSDRIFGVPITIRHPRRPIDPNTLTRITSI